MELDKKTDENQALGIQRENSADDMRLCGRFAIPEDVLKAAEGLTTISTQAARIMDIDEIVKATQGAVDAVVRISERSDAIAKSASTLASYWNALPEYPVNIDSLVPAFQLPDHFFDQIASTATKFSDHVISLFDTAEHVRTIADSYLEALRPNLDAIGSALSGLDIDGFWEKSRKAAEGWGKHGWVILEEMPITEIFACPDTTRESNRICRRYAFAELPQLRERLSGSVRKKKDALEMLALFDEGHLKSCAMMACSLIDGELMNWTIAKTGDRGTRGKPKGLKPVRDVKEAQSAAVTLISVVTAYDHFFRWGNGFNRKREGELNRNFLVHGMMNKPVTQIACLKLFLLLDRITVLLPICSVEGNSN